jgi:hypothetical protein
MSSFFEAADAAHNRYHIPDHPLDLGTIARKVFHPKAMVQPVKKRGSASAFAVFLLSGIAIFGVSLAALYFGDPYGLTQFMLYLAGAEAIAYLASYLVLPTRLWYSKMFRTFYKDFCFGMVTMSIVLAFIAPTKEFPSYVENSTPLVSAMTRHLKVLPSDKEVELMTRVLYGEARGEPEAGQKNVIQTIINRAENAKQRYGKSYTEVLIRPRAFSCMNPADPNFEKLLELDKKSLTFTKLRAIVVNTINDRLNGLPDPTQGSTHYHTFEVDPHWNRNAKSMIRIGNHQFWTGVDD